MIFLILFSASMLLLSVSLLCEIILAISKGYYIREKHKTQGLLDLFIDILSVICFSLLSYIFMKPFL